MVGTAEVASSRVEMYGKPVNNNNLPYAPYLFTCIAAMGQAWRPVIPLTYIRVLPVSLNLEAHISVHLPLPSPAACWKVGQDRETRPHLPIVWVAKRKTR